MSRGLLVLVSAPSGAGKTSLVNAALQADPQLVVSISHTTRSRRSNEQDGVNYHFVSPETFTRMVRDGEFLEHARVFDHQYGTAEAQVQALRDLGRDVVLEIDWQGADQVRSVVPDAVSIFILPPSEEALRARLTNRGEDSAQSMERRLAEARREMAQAHRYQYVVVNDDFDTALGQVLAILAAERLKTPVQLANDPRVTALLSP